MSRAKVAACSASVLRYARKALSQTEPRTRATSRYSCLLFTQTFTYSTRKRTMGASSTKLEPLKPVDNVPVRQLFGTWFVIAVMPTIFEKGAHNAIETYSDGGKPGAVDIDFRA